MSPALIVLYLVLEIELYIPIERHHHLDISIRYSKSEICIGFLCVSTTPIPNLVSLALIVFELQQVTAVDLALVRRVNRIIQNICSALGIIQRARERERK